MSSHYWNALDSRLQRFFVTWRRKRAAVLSASAGKADAPASSVADAARLDRLARECRTLLTKVEFATTPILLDQATDRPVVVTLRNPRGPLINPAIIKDGNEFLVIARSTNFISRLDGRVQTIVYPRQDSYFLLRFDNRSNLISSCELDDSLVRTECDQAKGGLTDLRLFKWRQALWAISAGRGYDALSAQADSVRTQILMRLNGAKVVDFRVLPSPNGLTIEKNWAPLVNNGQLYLIYGIQPFIAYVFDGDNMTLVTGNAVPDNNFQIRGGTPFVPWNGKFLAVAHLERVIVEGKHYYRHVFVVVDADMNIEDISEPFFIQRRGGEFACGLEIDADHLVLSYGLSDRGAAFCRLSTSELSRWIVV